jgi:photosystem II stability/assembly factor-like uncharacterized protein
MHRYAPSVAVRRRGVRAAAVAGCAVLTALAAPGHAAGPGTGVRDASGGSRSAQTEQVLAVNPRSPDDVLISFINGLSVSHDGGRTWTLNPEVGCTGDGNAAFDASGVAYYECGGNGVQIQVYRSTDGGEHWTGPVTAANDGDNLGDFIDRPWVVRGHGPHALVAGWESFFTNPAGWVFLRTSNDGGATWGTAHRVDDPVTAPAAWDPRQLPVVGADGTIYVAYASGHAPWIVPQTLPLDLVVAATKDGGTTFRRALAARGITRTSSPTEESETISSLAADPSPRRAGHLALTWADERTGYSRVLVVTSVDAGRTWSAPVQVFREPAGSADEQDHPQVAFAPDGRLVVVWRDRSCCGNVWKADYQLRARMLTVTRSRTLRLGRIVDVTDRPQSPNSSSMYDEYLGLVVGREGVSVAWNQVRRGVASTTFRRIPLARFA